MDNRTETPQWGSFALVSYIPDPLGSLLQRLRQTLPGQDNFQPHITILPPRPLKLPVDVTSELALKTLLSFPDFEVELSKVHLFPETQILYLDIEEGSELIHELHSALNSGDLAHVEAFLFRPHLTLAGPIPHADLQTLRQQIEAAWTAAQCPRRFLLSEIVFLWLPPGTAPREWSRLWSRTLSGTGNRSMQAASAATMYRRY